MKKQFSFKALVSFFLGFLAFNTLLQVYFVFSMYNRLQESLKMTKEGNKLSRLGLEGIYVLREIERMTGIMEEIGKSSDAFSTGGIATEDLEAILRGGEEGKAVRKKLSEGKVRASLVNFLRSVEEGKKDFAGSQRGLENSRKLLAFLKKGNRFFPEAVATAEASLKITEELAKLSKASQEIALQSFSNAEKAYEKLKKHKKFFARRRKFMMENRNDKTQEE